MLIDGAKLRELRRDRRITQAQLALLARVSRKQVSNLESGNSANLKLATVYGIADALELTPPALIAAIMPEPVAA